MTITTLSHNPSINIIRDVETAIRYISTPNSRLIFRQMATSYATSGRRSFSLVGSYGTGKSAFLLALQQTLSGWKAHFDTSEELSAFSFLPIVGEYGSFIEVMSRVLEVTTNTPKAIIAKLERLRVQAASRGEGFAILVDEFGKFLEYAAKHNPEKELYFVQQLAEWTNNSEKKLLFVLTLHQGLDAYALGLDKSQRQEWEKVKGRVKELAFNEPVEQLLAFAAKRLQKENHSEPAHFDSLFHAIEEAGAFPLQSYFDKSTARHLLPFDILAAAVLTLALQTHGQNERSLFSFIEGEEYLSIRDFNHDSHPFYNLSCVYDYMAHHYHAGLLSKYNPHYTQWAAIRNALERTEGLIENPKELSAAHKIIKSIGLLNIFAPASARLHAGFMVSYASQAMGIPENEVRDLLRDLEKVHRIIAFRGHLNRYRFQGDSNLDIELAINRAGEIVTQVPDFIGRLNENFHFPHLLAKAHFFETGNPRFFRFRLTSEPVDTVKEPPVNETDGFVNLIFSEENTEQEISDVSEKCTEAVLYGRIRNVTEIRRILLEIEKIKKVIEEQERESDRVAVRELRSIWQAYKRMLTSAVLGGLYNTEGNVDWFFKGIKVIVASEKAFNRQLSNICAEVYDKAPHVHFEMINKTRLSSAMLTARKKLVEELVARHTENNLGFEDDKFPPEKSIYLALLKRSGIHRSTATGAMLSSPEDTSFHELWSAGQRFLEDSKSGRRTVNEFIERLLRKPYKLKKGLLDFWLPIYLFIKRDEYALFGENGYIPNLTHEVLELLVKEPQYYAIKAFDIEGVRLDMLNSYRQMLNQNQELQFSNHVFVETIKPFLVFYKKLPEYAKRTKKISPEAARLREAISRAKDPEKSFFEDFPQALGYTALELQRKPDRFASYVPALETAIRDIRTAFDQLVDRFEKSLNDRIGGDNAEFPGCKKILQARYKKVKNYLLMPEQKVFLQRVNSSLDDRHSWLLSLAETCLGKRLEQMIDEEEPLLFDKLRHMIEELDQLSGLSVREVNQEKEIAFDLHISSLVENYQKNDRFVRLPKAKRKEMEAMENKMRKKLGEDRELNIAVLAKLLQEQMQDDKQA